MRNGEVLYETFFEHHSPFLFATLAALAPEGEAVPARPFFIRARWLTGLAGLAALSALAAALWRYAPEAAGLTAGLLFATGAMWLRGFAEIRAEAFGLAFFCGGMLLVLRARPLLSGVGVALIFTALLWNPKWPLAAVAVGTMFLIRFRKEWRSYAGALLGVLAAFFTLSRIVPLDAWWFFNFDVNLALSRAVQSSPQALDAYFRGGEAFLFVPEAFHPAIVVPATMIICASLLVRPSLDRGWPVILLVGAWLDLRFFLPWPAIWSHYYLMWSVASAATLAVVPVSIEVLLGRIKEGGVASRARYLAAGAGFLLVIPHVVAVWPTRGGATTYWVSERTLREQLRPGDTVWLEPARHPVTVKDAHYYWFLIGQMREAAEELRKTPRGRRYLPPTQPLPVCAPPPTLRFVLDPRRQNLAPEDVCFEMLVAQDAVRRTAFADVWSTTGRIEHSARRMSYR